MIKIYIILIIGLFTSFLQSKLPVTKKPVVSTVWQKVYGGESDDIARGIIMLEDSDSVIIGECQSFKAKRADICVTRINSTGQSKWNILLGGKKMDSGYAISRSKDGNLLVLGIGKSFSKNGDQDLYVAKLNLEGKLLWQKSLGGNRDEYAGGIAGTNDGGALIVGYTESFSPNGYKDIYIIRLDKNGNTLSSKTIGGKLNDEAHALTRTVDGNFMIAGSREIDRLGDSDFFLMKLDQKGNKLWAKTLGGEDTDILNAISATPDGGIVATGSTRSYNSEQSDLAVMYFNKDGKLIWFKIYGFKYYDVGNAITVTKDGKYLVAGKTNSMGKGGYDTYLLLLDRNGKLLWSDIYGGTNKDIAHAVTRTSDGAIMVVGESDSYSRSKNFYMIKLK